MRTSFLKAAATAVFLSLINLNEAMAGCNGIAGLICDDGGGSGPSAVPELDGPAGIAAIALLVSVVAVVYYKVRRR